MTITLSGYHLGKKDAVESPFGEFKTYLTDGTSITPPPSAHWGGRVRVPWQMDGNGPDPQVTIAPAGWGGCGDCTEAGKAHALTTANYNELPYSVPVPTGNAVVEQYAASIGCTPAQLFANPSQYDTGEDEVTTLTNWCNAPQYGVKLAMTAPVNCKSQKDLMTGIWLAGGLYIGIQLPQSASAQFPNEWTWQPSSPIEGGHCVWLTGYTADYVALVTWGMLIQCTWQFLLNTIDEAHALVLPQAISAGHGPTGLLLPQWESDLRNLNG